MSEDILTAAGLPAHLRNYWLGPKGSARVGGWDSEDSFNVCRAALRKEGVPTRHLDSLSTTLYYTATGRWPGEPVSELDVLLASLTVSQTDLLEAAQDAAASEERYAPWEGILTVEGVESGDGRMFTYGSLSWDNPPIPLMYQPVSIGGHNGSVMVGQIQQIYRKGNEIFGVGILDLKARYNGEVVGEEVFRLMDEGFLTGVSVDVDSVKDADVKLVFAPDAGPLDKPRLTVYNRGRVRGATLVAFPAFTQAKIFLSGGLLTAAAVGELLDVEEEPLVAASHTITIPDLPPAAWFEEPTDVELRGAFTVTDEGRIYGLLAPGGTTHRSVNKKVPHGNVDYSRWMKGETLVAGGGRIPTGAITFNCGHASANPEIYGNPGNRIKHYDNSCSVFADARVGERPDGSVWIAGAVKHYATAEQISAAMSCTLSGDWQGHPDKRGVREFVAALLVPVPGFAMARTEASVTMDYEDGALVASAVPVEFVVTDPELLVAAARKKVIFARKLGRDPESRKIELAKKLGRTGQNV